MSSDVSCNKAGTRLRNPLAEDDLSLVPSRAAPCDVEFPHRTILKPFQQPAQESVRLDSLKRGHKPIDLAHDKLCVTPFFVDQAKDDATG